MLNSNFEKFRLTPKSRLNAFLKFKLPNMTDWHILLGLKIDVLIACRRLSVSPRVLSASQDTVPQGHLQKFAADLT